MFELFITFILFTVLLAVVGLIGKKFKSSDGCVAVTMIVLLFLQYKISGGHDTLMLFLVFIGSALILDKMGIINMDDRTRPAKN